MSNQAKILAPELSNRTIIERAGDRGPNAPSHRDVGHFLRHQRADQLPRLWRYVGLVLFLFFFLSRSDASGVTCSTENLLPNRR